jgi:hypothetical protein
MEYENWSNDTFGLDEYVPGVPSRRGSGMDD